MCDLHSTEEGVQLLSSRPAATAAGRAETRQTILAWAQNRVSLLFASNRDWASIGYAIASELPALGHYAIHPEHGTSLDKTAGRLSGGPQEYVFSNLLFSCVLFNHPCAMY
jgi:hypothetical protein